MQLLGHSLGDIVLTVLLTIAACGFAWMGVWGLRGRDTHLPWTGWSDGNPPLPESDFDHPLRGRHARLAGGGFLLLAGVLLAVAITVWR